MKASDKNRRSWKNILINRKVQIRITAINLIFMVVAVALNTAVMLSSSLCNIYYAEGSQFWKFVDMYALSSEILTFSLTGAFVLAFFCQIVITHQVCGPLVNFKHSFNQISQGNLTRKVNLRKNDLLKNEAVQFNQMIDGLSTHIEEVKKDNQLMYAVLKSMADHPDEPERIENACKFIRKHADAVEKHLAQLKLPPEVLQKN